MNESARANMREQQEGQPSAQWDISWRWLKHSGLGSLLRPAVWLVFRDIVEADHQTMGMPSYRRGRDGAGFRLKHEGLMRTTGFTQRSVTRACAYLATTDLLSYYRPGTGTADGTSERWTEFGVNTETLKRLYAYVGPRLPSICGGIWGMSKRDLPGGGIRIYGITRSKSVCMTWENLFTFQTWVPAEGEPAGIDLEEVARICAL